MNSDNEFSQKKRRRSEQSYSYTVSSDRSKSKSKSHKKKSKKSKKKHKIKREKEHRDRTKTHSRTKSRSRSRSHSPRSKVKSSKKSNKKGRSRSRSQSQSSDHEPIRRMNIPKGMNQMMFPYHPVPPMPRVGDPRFIMRPTMYHPPGEFYGHGRVPLLRPPMTFVPKNPFQSQDIPESAPPDKIVKDQNFLNSDDKLFDSIINSDMNIRSLYSDVQISETYAGTTLYKTIKKLVYDPNTVIFDNNDKNYGHVSSSKIEKSSDEVNTIYYPKNGEVLKCVFDDIMFKNNDKKQINMGDMKEIRSRLLKELKSN